MINLNYEVGAYIGKMAMYNNNKKRWNAARLTKGKTLKFCLVVMDTFDSKTMKNLDSEIRKGGGWEVEEYSERKDLNWKPFMIPLLLFQ